MPNDVVRLFLAKRKQQHCGAWQHHKQAVLVYIIGIGGSTRARPHFFSEMEYGSDLVLFSELI